MKRIDEITHDKIFEAFISGAIDAVNDANLDHLTGMRYKDGILAAFDFIRGDTTLPELIDE